MLWVKVGGNQELSLGLQFGRLHVCVGTLLSIGASVLCWFGASMASYSGGTLSSAP